MTTVSQNRDGLNSAIETGDSLLAQGLYADADAVFEAAAREWPDDPQPLAGLVRVGRKRKDMVELASRLERFLQLCPDALEAKANLLQIVARRGDARMVDTELPMLLDQADGQLSDHETGRRLLHLIQFCLAGSRRTNAMKRLHECVEASVSGLSARSPTSRPDGNLDDRARADWLMNVFLSEIQLALGDYEAFCKSVLSLGKRGCPNALCRDVTRVRDKIVASRFPDFDQPKIFGIGLSRTGTTSLNVALNRLGFHSIHWINPMTMDLIGQPDFVLYDAFADIPVSYQFEQLYHTFPNSKFVFTTRDAESWETSIIAHYRNNTGVADIQGVNRSLALHRFANKPGFIYHNLFWGAVRIIETPGWGKLNLNRSVAYDE